VFVTTNHVERLDPALSIPGRMDVSVNFTHAHATNWQAEELFKLSFFPSRPPAASPPNESPSFGAPRENLTRARRAASAHAVPVLEEADILRWRRILLVVPYPLWRCVFSLSLLMGSDVLLIFCHFSHISLRASWVDRLGMLRRLATFLRAQRRWRVDLTHSINAFEVRA
jgi:hypothetical protein